MRHESQTVPAKGHISAARSRVAGGKRIPSWLLLAAVSCYVLCVSSRVIAAAPQSPLVVTHGGTYRGSWASEDADVPVVRVETTEPVVFDRCTFIGRGNLIQSRVDHSDITVRNCTGTGENPNIAGRWAGRFLEDESFDRVRVEHCELDHTAGIYLRECLGKREGGMGGTIDIVANRAIDIDGRKSDGHGGYLDFNLRTNKRTNLTEAGFSEVQFVQFDGVHGVPRVEIAWNHVLNEPGRSRVEDNINLYNSSGTAASPITIHDNCIRGAYNFDPSAQSKNDGIFSYDLSYSGGGIMLGDGAAKLVGDRPAYIEALDNVVIGTTNYGIAIAAGHDISFQRNVIVSAGLLPNGQPIAEQNVGAYIWNVYKPNRTIPSTFTANGGRDNVIGWMKGDARNDSWTPDAAFWTGNTAIKGPITREAEDLAEGKWKARAEQAGVHIGLEPAGH